uniref:caffeoyl-CoA O-methyltransferase n=1 Tax=Solanum lycopersicum TaxID=4081 RepID=A0A3Q7HD48_SOLLC
MATAPEAGQLIALLLKLTNPKKTIEIGCANIMQIIAIDLDREAYEMELPIIQKANIEHKINFIQSSTLSALDELLNENDNRGIFDFAFIDADRVRYQKYHERMLDLVKVGVSMPEECVKETMKPNRQHIIEFNKFLASDTHVQISQVPI